MPSWRKSSFSSGQISSDCLEVAASPHNRILLRESDDPTAVITTTPGSPDTSRT
ncbi:DUF397 domain-containing protein [Streptomyces sp. LZ34]